LGSGAVGRCFGRQRAALERCITIIKSKNGAVTGWHYQLSLRESSEDTAEAIEAIACDIAVAA
jgi:hypothetical protein